MRLTETKTKKILKGMVLYVVTLLVFIIPSILLLTPNELMQQDALYIEWGGRVILIFYILNPLFCILMALACSKWRANIFIVISLTASAFIYIAVKYMNDSALFYLAPYVLIEGLIYFIMVRKKIRLKYKEG